MVTNQRTRKHSACCVRKLCTSRSAPAPVPAPATIPATIPTGDLQETGAPDLQVEDHEPGGGCQRRPQGDGGSSAKVSYLLDVQHVLILLFFQGPRWHPWIQAEGQEREDSRCSDGLDGATHSSVRHRSAGISIIGRRRSRCIS